MRQRSKWVSDSSSGSGGGSSKIESAAPALRAGCQCNDLHACRGDEDSPFVCERVCTSDRLLKKLGSLAKEPTRDTCVTVCGVSGVCQVDAEECILQSPA